MKYGGVASQPSYLSNNVDLLRRMHAQTVRVSMFLNNAETKRYDFTALDQLRDVGLTEMIIQSAETADAAKVGREIPQFIGYVDANPNLLFIYELGNEPDFYGEDPLVARSKRLTALRDVRPNYRRPNLLWAVNEIKSDGDPAYFDAYNRDAHDGLGAMFYSAAANQTYAPYAPDTITVHSYGTNTLCPSSGEPTNPWRVLDYVRGWSTSINVKITEAGINDSSAPDRGNRYVEFVAKLDQITGGQVDSVCFYALPQVNGNPVEAAYNIRAFEADQVGSRQRSFYCS